ncbi:imidazole glycerol phosphate synthase subunit HisH [Entomobacter blattae]|uniref:Imidazole glycerol phosphate synthase subunit HisH n=1 Tax=Entomobacter blattae TaxID=2762277 RepID=A0A7H1NUM9_9PROT|nr:imidazole glycerol phosphate synthase subunit HisH [Entomobacter blattae]QNT79489.1 Imidazole glycerol phosphate synthase subunit HisH [Entomobacter blattae]
MKSLSVVVIDYNGGNLASAAQALEHAAQLSHIPARVEISNTVEALKQADRIVLPGQGAFRDCAQGLQNIPHLLETLNEVTKTGTPFLGICVGMQLMAEEGFENDRTPGLGWIKGKITKMSPPGQRLPQMGWNELTFSTPSHPLLQGLHQGVHGYFVHSYALSDYASEDIVATTDYGGALPAIVAKGNRAGTQFHVEKSQKTGLHILGNFLRWSSSDPV